MKTIKVHIADVSEILRSGITHLLKNSGQKYHIYSHPRALDLVQSYRKSADSVCIISSSLFDMNLKDTMQNLTEINPEVKAIVISGSPTISNINAALNMGIKGYITRQVTADELVNTIEAVWNNQQAFGKSVSKTIVDHYTGSQGAGSHPNKQSITKREQEVLTYIVKGLTSSEIAKRLYISPRTVETHRANLMQKLNIKNTAGLVRYALQEGENLSG